MYHRGKPSVLPANHTRARSTRSSAATAAELGLPVRGFASSGLPGPKGNRETFVLAGGEGEPLVDLEAALLEAEK